MLRLLQGLLTLSLVFALTACSDNSDSKGPKLDPNGNPIPQGPQGPSNPQGNNPPAPDIGQPNAPFAHNPTAAAGDYQTLPMTPWCLLQEQQGTIFQLRFDFNNDQSSTFNVFQMSFDQANNRYVRVNERTEVAKSGTYAVNGNRMYISYWQPSEFQVYVATSDESETNEPELRLTQKGENEPAILTSCE